MRKALSASDLFCRPGSFLHPHSSMPLTEDKPFRYQALPEMSNPTADIAGHFGEPDHSKTVI
jgi:hypothetical protein